jgi:hypothetical protein
MKTRLFILLIFLLSAAISYSQTYTFSKLVKKASVETSSGTQERILSTTQGPFRIIFETPNDPQMKRLFTVLKPGQSNAPGLPWFGHIKDTGYGEKGSTVFKKSLYYDTENDENILVLIAEDYSMLVIFKADDTIWEYIK